MDDPGERGSAASTGRRSRPVLAARRRNRHRARSRRPPVASTRSALGSGGADRPRASHPRLSHPMAIRRKELSFARLNERLLSLFRWHWRLRSRFCIIVDMTSDAVTSSWRALNAAQVGRWEQVLGTIIRLIPEGAVDVAVDGGRYSTAFADRLADRLSAAGRRCVRTVGTGTADPARGTDPERRTADGRGLPPPGATRRTGSSSPSRRTGVPTHRTPTGMSWSGCGPRRPGRGRTRPSGTRTS